MNGAILSPDEVYRYRLWRNLPEGIAGRGLFVMLNPSTADAAVDDPTIRRCTSFAQRFGWTRYDVVNLFSVRTTDPKKLPHLKFDLTGPDHHFHFRDAILDADMVICAWGADVMAVGPGGDAINLIRQLGEVPLCLGVSANGAPRHPLYLRKDAPLREYRP
jgi:hypothetical protein